MLRCEDIQSKPEKICRKRIAVDETIVVINKMKWYVWIAVNVKTEEILAFIY
ncbi:MAG TPA: hypothetical protein VJC21_04880 [Candidatus Nanoarchaeia archaeon]|nr:hypothetical protein [Candidatus Nanoarchaeia archaeon]